MIRVELLVGLLVTALWVFCLVEVISSRGGESRHLGKVPWLLIVLFFPLAGSLAWLVAGRPRRERRPGAARAVPPFPEYDRPGRACASRPEDDERFLRKVRERAEEQRRAYRAAQRAHELEEHEKLKRRSQEHREDQT